MMPTPTVSDPSAPFRDALGMLAHPEGEAIVRWLAAGPMTSDAVRRRGGWDWATAEFYLAELASVGLVVPAEGGHVKLDNLRLAAVAAFVGGLGHKAIT